MNELLQVKNLKKYYPANKRFFFEKRESVCAVDDISFSVKKYKSLGIVGESGCGKSTTGRCILRLHEPTEGEVWYKGKNICKLSLQEMRELRRDMQIVFQDPFSSLDPRKTIKKTLEEPFKIHHYKASGQGELNEAVQELLRTVGLSEESLGKYPHEFSGGQRQRIGIARALALGPSFVVCDEPVSALDVSIQAQILNLFLDMQEKLGITYVFISHDLAVAKFISHSICVMYLGKVVEMAETEELFHNQLHPYTQALISSIPANHPKNRNQRVLLTGDVPNPVHPPQGCRFHQRCRFAKQICREIEPSLAQVAPDHVVACHLYNN